MDWQPIDTAPKDGTHVIAYWTGAGGHFDIGYFTRRGAWLDAMDEPHPEMGWDKPTHWMPLPDPPDKPSSPLRNQGG